MSAPDTLTTLFRHHVWANLRLLERCAGLTSEQLDGTVSGAYSSIHNTLEHIATSELSYFTRISTGGRAGLPDQPPSLSLAEIEQSLRTTGAGLIEWAPKIRPEDTIAVDWHGTPRAVPKAILLTQVINHATEHRAQIMVIMTQLGVEPPDLQAWQYFDELGG